MRYVSLVDLGSNSARLVVYELDPGKGFRLLDEIREVIQLGAGIARNSELSDDAIARALAAVRTFSDFACAASLPKPRIMATSAVRSAANRDALLCSVREMGFEIEVLSGEVEAAQGVLAAANSFALNDAWVVDLGGGSMQVSEMRNRVCVSGSSHPFGAIRVSEQFLTGSDPPSQHQIAALRTAVDSDLGPLLARMRSEPLPVIVMGGTVRNLARAIQRKTAYPWPQMHGYSLDRRALEALVTQLRVLSVSERAGVSGINRYRADSVLGGALVLQRMLSEARLSGLFVSAYGMREGALMQEFLPTPHLLEDVRAFHIRNLAWCYPQPAGHTQRVVDLSRQLFEALSPLHGYGGPEAELLAAAAELHDIGKTIAHRDHAKHGEYLLAGATLAGFDHREQVLLALLVRFHRTGRPNGSSYRSILHKGDRRRLAQLTVCLRLAEYLDRPRTGRVKGVIAVISDEEVTLRLEADGEPWVELWEARKQARLFQSAYKRSLTLMVAST